MNLITQGLGTSEGVEYIVVNEIHSPSIEEVSFDIMVEELTFTVEAPEEIIFVIE